MRSTHRERVEFFFFFFFLGDFETETRAAVCGALYPGVALIASERIEEVAKTLDAMRARRFREQAEKARQLERRRGGDERVGVEAVAKDLMRRRVVKGRTSGDVGGK